MGVDLFGQLCSDLGCPVIAHDRRSWASVGDMETVVEGIRLRRLVMYGVYVIPPTGPHPWDAYEPPLVAGMGPEGEADWLAELVRSLQADRMGSHVYVHLTAEKWASETILRLARAAGIRVEGSWAIPIVAMSDAFRLVDLLAADRIAVDAIESYYFYEPFVEPRGLDTGLYQVSDAETWSVARSLLRELDVGPRLSWADQSPHSRPLWISIYPREPSTR